MKSRFFYIIYACFFAAIAIFFKLYFNGIWGWIVSMPLAIFASLGFYAGLFLSEKDVDKLFKESADKDGPINLTLCLIELVYFGRYILYAVTVYLSFISFHFYIVPLISVVVSLVNTLDIIRLNMIRNVKMTNGIVGILKNYLFFYILDFIIVSFFYGLGLLISSLWF